MIISFLSRIPPNNMPLPIIGISVPLSCNPGSLCSVLYYHAYKLKHAVNCTPHCKPMINLSYTKYQTNHFFTILSKALHKELLREIGLYLNLSLNQVLFRLLAVEFLGGYSFPMVIRLSVKFYLLFLCYFELISCDTDFRILPSRPCLVSIYEGEGASITCVPHDNG